MLGAVRASRAPGHTINAGLPETMPAWLNHVRGRDLDLPRIVRHGMHVGRHYQVNWRDTIRGWAKRGHADGQMVWRREPRGPGSLVVLWDVSGSMANYVAWYFPWLYQMAAKHREVSIYAFGTETADLTPYLHGRYEDAVRDLYNEIGLWGSGTAMGRAFRKWYDESGQARLGTRTAILIISDGWDVGGAEELDQALHTMALRAREMVWVNPLMVTKSFEPRTRALKIARQYVSSMTAGATPNDLLEIAWRLGYG